MTFCLESGFDVVLLIKDIRYVLLFLAMTSSEVDFEYPLDYLTKI